MASGMKKMLGLEMPSKQVLSTMLKTNLDITSYESFFVAALSMVLAAATLLPIPPWTYKPPEMVMTYRIGFVFLAIACVLIHFAVDRIKNQSNKSTAASLAMLSFIIVVVGTGMWLTIADYWETQNLVIYIAALGLVFGILFLPPLVTLIIIVVCTIVMMAVLTSMGSDDFTSRAVLVVCAFLIMTVSMSNYHTRLRITVANEAVMEASIHDELTDTKNRRALSIDAAKFVGHPVHLLLGDIDEFKFYNDSFGHAAGDVILQRFAKSMVDAFDNDHVYRYGGDEFVAVMRDETDQRFLEAIDRWRSGFIGIEVNGEVYTPTTSGGYVSGTPKNEADFHEMLRLADIRLYDAKQAGRNTVLGSVFDEQSQESIALGTERMRNRSKGDGDQLTGLPSITYFYTHAKTVVDSPNLEGANINIVYFNIENMSTYNERFGMTSGDELLIFAAKTIKESFEHALVSRFGGDRFVMLTYGDDLLKGIERVYDKVRSFNTDAHTEIRAGVYPYRDNTEINIACDRAKQACDHIVGNYSQHYYVYDDELGKSRDLEQIILSRFDEALANGHIRVHYQPVFNMEGGIRNLEALARWDDPEAGSIAPGDFVPVLEEFRLIHKLDLHIVEAVCADYQSLAKQGREMSPVNVNVSHYDMELCDIVKEIASVLNRNGMPASLLSVEIGEDAFSHNINMLHDVIDRFHEHGMCVWMDDFGSGSSSLSVLCAYDLDAVKIDLQALETGGEHHVDRLRKMLPHVIDMAKDLGICTVVESVETPDQHEFLKSIGCENAQGFAFAHPTPIGQIS